MSSAIVLEESSICSRNMHIELHSLLYKKKIINVHLFKYVNSSHFILYSMGRMKAAFWSRLQFITDLNVAKIPCVYSVSAFPYFALVVTEELV